MTTKLAARLSLAAVAAIAATASYLHALVVVQAADGRAVVAYFIPLLADLVITSAALNILDASRTGHARPRWSVLAVGVGIGVTLGANVMSGYPHAVPSWLVNGWPPVAFVLGLESIVGMVRRSREEAKEVKEAVFLSDGEPADLPPLPVALDRLCAAYSERQVAELLRVPRTRVKAARQPVAPEPAVAALNGSGVTG